MPFLGTAAMLLSFDVEADAIAEHDRWHTHEHLPERLAIPGFLRGTRWTAVEGAPRYMVVYEVASLDVLSSAAYLARLNDPTPWTTRVMPHYRGMVRGLCTVAGSFGFGQGGAAALVRFAPDPVRPDGHGAVLRWLLDDALPALPGRAGLGSAHLLQGAQPAAMTREQRIRGADASVDHAIVVTGYDAAAVSAAAQALAGDGGLAGRGACAITWAGYRMDYALSASELAAGAG